MKGLIYKEWKQNRLLIAGIALLIPVMGFLAPYLFLQEVDLGYPTNGVKLSCISEAARGYWTAFMVLAFLAACFLHGLVFRGDDRKIWAVFTASTPSGVRGYLCVKYGLSLLLCLTALGTGELTNLILCIIEPAWSSYAFLLLKLTCCLVFMQALDMPFTVRFGVRNGSIIKTIAILVFALILAIAILTNPENIAGQLYELLFNEENADYVSNAARRIVELFPVIALAAFCISYFISCRLYMKGAEQYDK